MATRTQKSIREDWIPLENVDLPTGPGTVYRNRFTGEKIAMPEGLHPMDNQNAIQLVPDTTAEPEEEVEETAEDRLKVLLSQSAGDTKSVVKLYRIKQDGSKPFCREYSAEEFESAGFESIRHQFGAGKYKVIFYGTKPETGKFGIRSSAIVDIEPSLVPIPNPHAQPNPIDAAMAERLARIEERLTAGAQPAGMDFKTMLETMLLLKQVFAAPPAPSMVDQITGLSGMVQAMQGLKDLANPAPVPDDPLVAFGLKAMEIIPPLIAKQQAGQLALPAAQEPARLAAPSVDAAVPPAGGNGQLPNPAGANGSGAQVPSEQDQLRAAIERVNFLAQMKTSPSTAAELIYENGPEDIGELLAQPNWFEQLSAAVPSMKSHEAWYREVAKSVLEIVAEESQPAAPNQPSEGASA